MLDNPSADVVEEVRRSVHSLKLHRLQKIVLGDKHRFRVIVAGRRWGKSQASKVAIITAAASKRKQLVWYVAPTYAQARDIMWDDLKGSIPRVLVKANGINETRMQIRLINGSIIQLKGADNPESLRGIGLNFVVIDECQDIKKETWETVLQPTLSTTNGRAIFIGSPKGFDWFYDNYQKGQAGEMVKDERGRMVKNEWKSWQFPTITSPFIPKKEIDARRRDMDPKSFRQEFEASFENVSGRVYYPFDRNVHVGDFEYNPQLPIYIGMDFNIDPMSCVILQEQPNGEIWAVNEVVRFGSNVQDTADELARQYWREMRRRQVQIYPDPAGNNRNHDRGETSLQVLREAGFHEIYFKRKHPVVQDRINTVNRLLRSADGKIILKIDRKCRKLIESLEQTVYKEGTKDIDKTRGVEHSADALGYYADFRHPMRKVQILGLSI